MSNVTPAPVRRLDESEPMIIFGDQIWLPYTSADTNGSMAAVVAVLPPESGPGLHVHLAADEFFYVIEGEFRFKVGDAVVDVSAGSCVFVPRGTPHGFMNTGSTPGRVLATFTPGGPELFFSEVSQWPPGQPTQEKIDDLNRRTQGQLLGHPVAKICFGW